MTIQLDARAAYASGTNPARSFRSVDYDLISRVTQALKKASRSDASDFESAVRAVHENNKLWIAIGSSVSDPANKLPAELRAGLFYLSEFVAVHSRRILKQQSDLTPLIDVNISVLRGLAAQKGTP